MARPGPVLPGASSLLRSQPTPPLVSFPWSIDQPGPLYTKKAANKNNHDVLCRELLAAAAARPDSHGSAGPGTGTRGVDHLRLVRVQLQHAADRRALGRLLARSAQNDSSWIPVGFRAVGLRGKPSKTHIFMLQILRRGTHHCHGDGIPTAHPWYRGPARLHRGHVSRRRGHWDGETQHHRLLDRPARRRGTRRGAVEGWQVGDGEPRPHHQVHLARQLLVRSLSPGFEGDLALIDDHTG